MSSEEAMRQIAEMGFDAVELAIWDIEAFPRSRIRDIKRKLESWGLELANICCNDNVYVWSGPVYTSPDKEVRRNMVERVKKTIEAAVEWNCEFVSLWPGSDVIPLKIPYWQAWNFLVETVSDCVKLSEDHDVRLTLEYKPECILNNADSTLRILNQINSKNLGALLDTGHAIVAREHLPTVVEMFKDKLFHVHIDDNYGDWDRDLPPGTVHNFEPFLQALKRVGYKGYLSMDVWPYEDPYNEIKMGKEYLETLMQTLK